MKEQLLTTYQKLSTEFYDLGSHPGEKTALPFYMNYAHHAQGPILEPMCGTGRFLIPMIQAGLDVEGFDASPHMLNALKQKLACVSDKPAPVWQQFVQDFKSDKQYNLIFVPYGSWGLIIDLSISRKCLEIMYHHLAPGGKFVLEIETVDSAPKESGVLQYAEHTKPDGAKIKLEAFISYNQTSQIFSSQCHYTLLDHETIQAIEYELFEQYLFRFDEMDCLLQNIGFTQIKKYQDHSQTPATDVKTPLLIYECIK